MTQECLCDRCTALCCRYFALGIDEPDTPEEFDDIRWYLAHENVHVFIEDGDWFLAIQTKCQYLQDDNRCAIYEDRPKICREYSTDNCDYHTGQYDFEQYFTLPQQLEAYAQALLGERYKRYAVRQRHRNVGLDKTDPDRPKPKHVLAARARPLIKGHPSRHRPGRSSALGDGGAGEALVALSIDSSGH